MKQSPESYASSFTTLSQPEVMIVIPSSDKDYFILSRMIENDVNYSSIVFSIQNVCSQRIAIYCSSEEALNNLGELLTEYLYVWYQVVYTGE